MSSGQTHNDELRGLGDLSRFGADLVLKPGAEYDDVAPSRYGFDVGDISLLMPAEATTELVELPRLVALPNTQAWLRGLANLRGNLVPVFDLGLLLGDAAARAMNTSNVVPLRREVLLVIGESERVAGIVLDNLPRACSSDELVPTAMPGVLPEAITPHITNTYLENDQTWLEFDPHSLFTTLRDYVELR